MPHFDYLRHAFLLLMILSFFFFAMISVF